MTKSAVEIAEAFSGHRFAEAYDHLADDVEWVVHGGPTLRGRQAVIDACQQTEKGLTEVTARFLQFRTVDGGDSVVVDVIGEYVAEGTTRVASCDLYDFVDQTIVRITSYTVELVVP